MRRASGVAGALERTPGVFEEVGHKAEYQGCGSEVIWARVKEPLGHQGLREI